MNQRKAKVKRKTRETNVEVEINLDGKGVFEGRLELGFLSHMLELLSLHSRMDLKVIASGDLKVDDHHLTEDLGITLGQALGKALGAKEGIVRYGSILMPMDEVLVAVAVDLGGRSVFRCDYQPRREMIGDLSTELVSHFFRSLSDAAGCNLHFRFLDPGENEHHRVEAMFKGFARALRAAMNLEAGCTGKVPSTKGVLL